MWTLHGQTNISLNVSVMAAEGVYTLPDYFCFKRGTSYTLYTPHQLDQRPCEAKMAFVKKTGRTDRVRRDQDRRDNISGSQEARARAVLGVVQPLLGNQQRDRRPDQVEHPVGRRPLANHFGLDPCLSLQKCRRPSSSPLEVRCFSSTHSPTLCRLAGPWYKVRVFLVVVGF